MFIFDLPSTLIGWLRELLMYGNRETGFICSLLFSRDRRDCSDGFSADLMINWLDLSCDE